MRKLLALAVLPALIAALVGGCRAQRGAAPAPATAEFAAAPATAAPLDESRYGASRLRSANDFYSTLMLYKTDLKERDIDKCKRHTQELVRTIGELGKAWTPWLTPPKRADFERYRATLPPLVADLQNALAMNNLVFAKQTVDRLVIVYGAMEEALR
ncbi:MAG: hypothetical protein HZA54_17850 [Planctomycetes bacterium]|nr:hypothetical protein [Planctomycetota bacterium]